MALRLDHIIYATTDVEESAARIGEFLGVELTAGGQHLGIGTYNELLSLGDDVYLEVIGPDPSQPTPGRPRPFGIDDLEGNTGKLASFAYKAPGLTEVVAASRSKGHDPGDAVDMERTTPTGQVLKWSLAMPQGRAGGGLIPSLIDWGDTPNPASSSARGCLLLGLQPVHPEPATIQAAYDALGVDMAVAHGAGPALIATIKTPTDVVELR